MHGVVAATTVLVLACMQAACFVSTNCMRLADLATTTLTLGVSAAWYCVGTAAGSSVQVAAVHQAAPTAAVGWLA